MLYTLHILRMHMYTCTNIHTSYIHMRIRTNVHIIHTIHNIHIIRDIRYRKDRHR